MFHSIPKNTNFPLTWGSWRKSDTVIIERPANDFSGIIINISTRLKLISVHKSLDTVENSTITKYFTSDRLFLKTALDLSFKPNIVPDQISKLKSMLVPLIFSSEISVG